MKETSQAVSIKVYMTQAKLILGNAAVVTLGVWSIVWSFLVLLLFSWMMIHMARWRLSRMLSYGRLNSWFGACLEQQPATFSSRRLEPPGSGLTWAGWLPWCISSGAFPMLLSLPLFLAHHSPAGVQMHLEAVKSCSGGGDRELEAASMSLLVLYPSWEASWGGGEGRYWCSFQLPSTNAVFYLLKAVPTLQLVRAWVCMEWGKRRRAAVARVQLRNFPAPVAP